MRHLAIGLVLIFAACGDDNGNGNGNPDAGAPDAGEVDLVARGDYLVNHVLACVDCHTPRTETGAFDQTRALSGVECFIDVNGPAAGGCLHTRNLTHHATGLMNRSDAEIKQMLQTGVRPGGTFLHPVMPYWLFANMEASDADAIVAYLRTVTGVDHQVPPSDPPFANVPAAAPAAQDSAFPAATGESAQRGRYIAKLICVDCHTVQGSDGTLDYSKVFQGGREFRIGLPSPPFPEAIYTVNLTPHATGLAGWTAADIVRVLKEGKDKDGGNVCPPMPSASPMDPFRGLTDEDAMDVANYLIGLEPKENAIPNQCVAP